MNAMLLGTVCTAIKNAIRFHAVTNDSAAAMRASGRQRVDGTLETVEDMRSAAHTNLKTLIINIPTNLASHGSIFPSCSSFIHNVPLFFI